MLSEVVDKGAFCPRGCSKALSGGKAHSVPKHWFVELVKAIRVLVRPQGGAREPGPVFSLRIFLWRVCLSLGMPGDHISSGELSMYVFCL